jgi:exopolysaccharide production protein ExoQ
MPPILAFFLTSAFIIYLFRRDMKEEPNITGAVWLPLTWLLIIETRSVCQWLATFGVPVAGSLDEGTPLDAFIYLMLILAGMYVLKQRAIKLEEVVRNNGWVAMYLAYCFIAISWSDFPFVAFKHWIKVIGHPIMVLILLTEPDPAEAILRLFKRSAYVFVPFSIMAIKYFEDIGQSYDLWSGAQANNGIALDKNTLGCGCMILGCFFIWNLLKTLSQEKSRARRRELYLTAGFLYMVGWLFWKAHSATAFIALLLCTLMMIFTMLPFVNKRAIGAYVILGAIILTLAQLTFGIFGQITALSGHEETFNGRGKLWDELLNFNINPVLGTGFESFWLGDRLKRLWAEYWWHPNEAHNGYLETYLNLGIVGLAMLAGLLISAFRKASLALSRGDEFGRFRLGFLIGVVVYNWTESGFRGLDPVWFVFFILAMVYPYAGVVTAAPNSEAAGDAGEIEFASCTGKT